MRVVNNVTISADCQRVGDCRMNTGDLFSAVLEAVLEDGGIGDRYDGDQKPGHPHAERLVSLDNCHGNRGHSARNGSRRRGVKIAI